MKSTIRAIALCLMTPAIAHSQVAYDYGGEIDTATGAWPVLTPIGTLISGQITLDSPGAGQTTNDPAALSDIVVELADPFSGGVLFCFAFDETVCGGGAFVPILEVAQLSLDFDSSNFPVAGSIDIVFFSPTFQIDLPLLIDVSNGRVVSDNALGVIAGNAQFLRGAPSITLSSPDIAFDTLTLGATSEVSLDVTNTGTDALAIGSIGSVDPLLPPYAIANDACSGATLMPGDECTVSARFSPTVTGEFADSFDIPSNDPIRPSVTVAVSGDATGISGTFNGITGNFAVCQNLTTGQTAILPLGGETSWDCGEAGLLASPGDVIQIRLRGPATTTMR